MTEKEYYIWLWQNSPMSRAGCFPLIVVAIVMALLLSGCTTVKYVPVETVRTDTLYQKVVQRDSIHVHDSVTIMVKGDTVKIEHWRTQWRDRLLRDTVYRSRVDSIQVPYPVEKDLPWWDKQVLRYSPWIVCMLAGIIILLILWKYRLL